MHCYPANVDRLCLRCLYVFVGEISMFPSVPPRETLRFSGNKIIFFPSGTVIKVGVKVNLSEILRVLKKR